MDILLIAGLWLKSSVWDAVASELEARGHRAVPVALPGQGDGRSSAILADQVAAVLAALDDTHGKALVVGHSASSSLAWIAADARPGKVAKVVLIGGMPVSDGQAYADFFGMVDGGMPFPGWGAFDGPDSDDLSDDAKSAIADGAIPVPEGVATGIVSLTDERRFGVPVVMVCPEFSPEQAKSWVDAGEIPELAKAESVHYVDIDSGHWPMFTKPVELAEILADLASE